MDKHLKNVSNTVGLPPGTLVHVGKKTNGKAKITIFDYDQNHYEEKETDSIEDCYPFKDKPTVTWININGIQDVDIIEKIDTHFEIHPLVLEDIVNTSQRPKLEDYGDYIFIVLKMLIRDPKTDEIVSEQISLILGSNYVISFQETAGDIFNTIRERIRHDKGRVRKMGADYLAYCLIDAIVDHYFIIFEDLGEEIEILEDELLVNAEPGLYREVHRLKKEIISLRRHIWPLREVVSGLQRSESKLIKKATGIFLRDVYDHTIQVIDTIESYRDIIAGMHDIYLSSISYRMNEIMKVLTIISTIFIPITFIASVYGMNFKFMPELESPSGYFITLSVMAVVIMIMLIYFRRKKWI